MKENSLTHKISIQTSENNLLKVTIIHSSRDLKSSSHVVDPSIVWEDITNCNNLPSGQKEFKWKTFTFRVDHNNSSFEILQSNGVSLFNNSSNQLVPKEGYYSITSEFSIAENEFLFGLGQHQEGILNWRERNAELMHTNTRVAIPVIISSKGYALYWDQYSYTLFNSDKNQYRFTSEYANQIQFYIITGENTDSLVAGIRRLTGKTSMLPKWFLGYIQSRERYKSQNEIIKVVNTHKVLGIPLDVIVLDWRYWPKDHWGQKSFDPERFPSPREMVRELHEKYDVHLMISIWPQMGKNSADFSEMKESGFLYTPDSDSSVYDAFDEKARSLYWQQLTRELVPAGVDAWWADATEPELDGWNSWHKEVYYSKLKPSIGQAELYILLYSYYHTKGIFEHQRNNIHTNRVAILSRSSFIGQQKFAAATWSGDVNGTWDELRNQITAGLNFCITGIPYWTTDIGGFFVYGLENWKEDRVEIEKIEDPFYRELYIRWFQFSVFCPLLRSHGTDLPREIYKFGKPGDKEFEILLFQVHLRYQLMLYIYSMAFRVYSEDYTMMRALVFDFPEDTKALNLKEEYMFGDSLLICPVTEPNIDNKTIYLPKCKGWFNFYTFEKYDGGIDISIPLSLEKIPVFVKQGSILPFLKKGVKSFNNHSDLIIFPGEDATFLFYEDDHETYLYEKDQYFAFHIKWFDNDKILLFDDSFGQLKNKYKPITFDIYIIDKDSSACNYYLKPIGSINYYGTNRKIKIN